MIWKFILAPTINREQSYQMDIIDLLKEKFSDFYYIREGGKNDELIEIIFKKNQTFQNNCLLLKIKDGACLEPGNIISRLSYQTIQFSPNDSFIEQHKKLLNEKIPDKRCIAIYEEYTPELFDPIINYLIEYFHAYTIDMNHYPIFFKHTDKIFQNTDIWQQSANLII